MIINRYLRFMKKMIVFQSNEMQVCRPAGFAWLKMILTSNIKIKIIIAFFLKIYIYMCTNKVTRWIDTQQTAHSMKCSHYLYHLLLKDLKKNRILFYMSFLWMTTDFWRGFFFCLQLKGRPRNSNVTITCSVDLSNKCFSSHLLHRCTSHTSQCKVGTGVSQEWHRTTSWRLYSESMVWRFTQLSILENT